MCALALGAMWVTAGTATSKTDQGDALDPMTAREVLAQQMRVEAEGEIGVVTQAISTVDEALTAIGMDPADAINPSITGDGRAYGVFAGLGTLSPTQGGNFFWFSSGVAGAATPYAQGAATTTEPGTDLGVGACPDGDTAARDCLLFKFSFVVPIGINSIIFDHIFLSAEYPEFVGTVYNDTFEVFMDSPSYTGQIVFDANNNLISVNSAFFQMAESQLGGTGFGTSDPGDAGATGLLTTQAPVTPGETVTLTFKVKDEGDGIYDSAVFLDNFQYSTEVVDEPNTQGQVDIWWVSPKSGPIEGGQQVTFHGMNFANVSEVRFGSEVAQFAEIDTETLVAVAPPAAVIGAVDVTVTAGAGANQSVDSYPGGYIYYDETLGAGIDITNVDPPIGPTLGNVFVTIYGAGLNADTIVTFDGIEVLETHFVNGGQLVVETPPHGEGAVEVRATNVDGTTASLDQGYKYLDNPFAAGGDKGCSCAIGKTKDADTSGTAMAILLGALALAYSVVRRKRRRRNLKRIGRFMSLLLGGLFLVLFATGCNDQQLAEVNSPPLANAGPNSEALVGASNMLDATNSTDPDGDDIVAWTWVIQVAPADSTGATIEDPSAEVANFIPDVPGLYKIGLVVEDMRGANSGEIGYGGHDDDNLIDIVALPFHDFAATLEWDTAPSDLDLHFIRPGGAYWAAEDDCFYGSPDPEWGMYGIHSDNPKLELDIDTGFGPETIRLKSAAEPGNYLLLVHAFNMHGGGDTYPRVTVEMNGGLAGEFIATQPMAVLDDVWLVAEVQYPSGQLTEINQFTTHQALGGPAH